MIKIREEFVDYIFGSQAEVFPVYKNPTPSEVKEFIKEVYDKFGTRKSIRGIIRPNGDLYAWHAYGQMHANVAKDIKIKSEGCWWIIADLNKEYKIDTISAKYMVGNNMGKEVAVNFPEIRQAFNKVDSFFTKDGLPSL